MKCPACSNELKEVKTKSAIVDICPHCKGIWFDKGELADFVRALTESEDISPRIPRLFQEHSVKTTGEIEEKERVCPRCEQKLKKFNYFYDSNVFLDKCPQCKGIWADGGEVKQLAGYLKKDPRLDDIGKALIHKNKTLDDLVALGKVLKKEVYPFVLFMPKIIIPYSDNNPRQRVPLVTISLIVLCVLVYMAQMFLVKNPAACLQKFAVIPADFLSIGLITSLFLHGNIFHLLGNMLFLWIFGDNVEDRFSRLGFLGFFILCGVFADILHIVFNWNSTIPAIGASGAISGIMGAYFVFYPTATVNLLVIYRVLRVPAFIYIGMWFLFQLLFGVVSSMSSAINVAWFAHIGGFLFGSLFAYYRKKMRAE